MMNVLGHCRANPQVKVGMWVAVRHERGAVGKIIRYVLGRSWSDHTAPVLEKNGELVIGDARPGGAVITTINEYQAKINKGEISVRVYDIPFVSFSERHWASAWWLENVLGRPYDYMAYPRLLLKAVFGNWFKKAAGWEWAWYCTESFRDMYMKPREITRVIDPLGGNNPTPRTVENRVASGILIFVTGKLMVDEICESGDL